VRSNRPVGWDPATQRSFFDSADTTITRDFYEAMHSLSTATGLAEEWNGTSETTITVSGPAGATNVSLNSVSCPGRRISARRLWRSFRFAEISEALLRRRTYYQTWQEPFGSPNGCQFGCPRAKPSGTAVCQTCSILLTCIDRG
jgi:hypothetical protein